MSSNDEYNPFADSSIRQATAASFANQPPLQDYNPFLNTTVAAQNVPPPTNAAVIPPTQTNSYQSPYYPQTNTYNTAPQSSEKSTSDARPANQRIDLSQYERQQAELEEREKRLAERERVLTDQSKPIKGDRNFPPIPKCGPCGPCFFQDISIEIPTQFQMWVRYLYYLWLLYSIALLLNMIAGLSYFVVDKDGGTTFGLSLVYLVIFVPASYVCWFRPIYRAFREDSAASFMIFFMVFFIQLVISSLQCLGIANFGCGFIIMIKLFIMGGKSIAVGLIALIVTASFAVFVVVGSLLMIKVHRLYRQSGASLEEAQREFQSAFVNNPTVRGAAREVATAGINEAVGTYAGNH